MANKVEIDVELLESLVDAAGWVSTFSNMFHNGETSENCVDLNAAEYLASEAVLIEQRGRAVLESAQHAGAMDGLTYCLCGDVIPSDEYRCMNCKALEDARH